MPCLIELARRRMSSQWARTCLMFRVPPISGRSVGSLHALRHVQLGFAEVADARRETEAQQVHQGEDVIGEAGRVGVVLLDPQVGLVVQQAVEHIGGIAHADIHHAGAERRVLVGDMGVEQPSRLTAVLRVDVSGARPGRQPGNAGHRRMRWCRRPSGRRRHAGTGG